MMQETVQTFFAAATAAAETLGDAATAALITGIQARVNPPLLRLLIVGATGVGRCAVGNALIGRPALLPVSPLPKSAIPLLLDYGEAVGVEITTRQGVRMVAPVEKLRAFYLSPETDASHYQQVDVRCPSPLLRSVRIRIESLESDRSPDEWQELLAGTDYVLFVLNATALLSEAERRFIREILVSGFGLGRVALVLNQMDRVPEEDREPVVGLVRTFLGEFAGEPLMMEYVAVRRAPEADDPLRELVETGLLEQHGVLRSTTLRRTAEVCVAALESGAVRRRALLEADEGELQARLARLDSEDQWVQAGIQRAQQRAEVFINQLHRERFFRDLEGFGAAFREQLPAEILAAEDSAALRRHLPGYIEAAWRGFLAHRTGAIRQALVEEMRRIVAGATEDFAGALESVPLPGAFDEALPAGFRAMLVPRRGVHHPTAIATSLQFGGLLGVVLGFASLPIGASLIGGGQLLRLVTQRGAAVSEREALAAAAWEAGEELERQVKAAVAQWFTDLVAALQQGIAALYLENLSRICAELEAGVVQRRALNAEQARLDELELRTLPALREQLVRLFGPGEPAVAALELECQGWE